MNFTQKLYLLAFFTKSNLNASLVRLWVALLVAASCFSTITVAHGAVIFDNISNFENSVPGATNLFTGSTPNMFMGDGYNLISGANTITGFDTVFANLTTTTFDTLKV